VRSRFTGGGETPPAAFNASSGLIVVPGGSYYGLVPPGENTCVNGECGLPGESVVVTGCESAVTVFTMDYDAPETWVTEGLGLK
jgi:5'-nucleotidase